MSSTNARTKGYIVDWKGIFSRWKPAYTSLNFCDQRRFRTLKTVSIFISFCFHERNRTVLNFVTKPEGGGSGSDIASASSSAVSFTRKDLDLIREMSAHFVTLRDHALYTRELVENMHVPLHKRVSLCKLHETAKKKRTTPRKRSKDKRVDDQW